MNPPSRHMTLPRDQAQLLSTPPEETPQEVTMGEVETAHTDPNHNDLMQRHPTDVIMESLENQHGAVAPPVLGPNTGIKPTAQETQSPEITLQELETALQDPNYQQEN